MKITENNYTFETWNEKQNCCVLLSSCSASLLADLPLWSSNSLTRCREKKGKASASFQPLLWWRLMQFGCLAAPSERAKLE